MAKRNKALAPEDAEALLKDWIKLNKDLMSLPISAVQQLLELEINGNRRPQVVMRLYGRFNRLREQGEKSKLLSGGELPWRK